MKTVTPFQILKYQRLKATLVTLSLLVCVPVLLGTADHVGAKPQWTSPVPKAECGANDRVETALQGQTSIADRESGRSELGYNCNLELVGQHQGEGMWWFGGGENSSYHECTYYSTRSDPAMVNPGVTVLDVSDPAKPRATAYLNDTAAMRSSHESLKVHERRGLLMGVQSNPSMGPNVAIYDISHDCRHPILLSTFDVPGMVGHAGNFSQDGYTYYIPENFRGQNAFMPVIDVFDPKNPKVLARYQFPGDGRAHDPSFNVHGTRMYSPQPGTFGNTGSSVGPNGLVIMDVSEFQFRRPNPTMKVVGRMFWEDGGQAQQAKPFKYKGKDFIIFTDESGSGGVGGFLGACSRGLSPSGFARIIDISDETQPIGVAQLRLEVHDPANCEQMLGDPSNQGYNSHYCNFDRDKNPRLVACSYMRAGIRVFDIRDPYRPREIAYYKPPARRTAFLPGSSLWSPGVTVDRTDDFASTEIRWVKHKGETHLWFSSADNGFQVVRFTNDVIEDIRAGDAIAKAERALAGIFDDDD